MKKPNQENSKSKVLTGTQLIVVNNPHSVAYFETIKGELIARLPKEVQKKTNIIFISSRTEIEDLNRLDFSEVKAIYLLITVETYWTNSEFEGYELAVEMMKSSTFADKVLNLHFVSFLGRQHLLEECDKAGKGLWRVMPKSFPHFQLPFSADRSQQFQTISERKWNYLKNYCLLASGVIDILIHDVRSLDASPSLDKLNRFKASLIASRDVLSPEIVEKAKSLSEVDDVETKRALLDIHRLLLNLQIGLNDTLQPEIKKSFSRMILVEDDEITLRKLESQLGKYFEVIHSFRSGTAAYQELLLNGREYDVLFTDLELLQDSCDDEKMGIDLLELCEAEYPFIVTRVITALPKNALKRLFGRSFDEVIFKSFGADTVIPSFENLIELVTEIDKEVEQRRKLRLMQGPNISWWKRSLTKSMYLMKITNPDEYISKWRVAETLAQMFWDGEFDRKPDEEKLSTQFGQVLQTIEDPVRGMEIIETLLAHRLIVLGYAAKRRWKAFDFDEFADQQGFNSGIQTKSPKAYLNTFLGLSGSGFADKPQTGSKCTILQKDLFPEELNWLGRFNPGELNEYPLLEVNPDFHNFIILFFETFFGTDIDEDIRYGEAIQLLDTFILEYPEQKMDKVKHPKLKRIFEMDYRAFRDEIPTEALERMERIREEILQ
jgi:CheY-like chemotaxis protein